MPSRLLASVVALAALAPLLPAAEPTDRDLLKAVERQRAAALAAAGPSLATVVVSHSERYPPRLASADAPGKLGEFDRKAFLAGSTDPVRTLLGRRLDLADPRSVADNSYGGGVVIDPAGLVLTNHHVVDGATKIYVRFPGGNGSYADVHAADARSDLAVLKLIRPPAGLRAIRLGEVRTDDAPDGTPANTAAGTWVLLAALAPDAGERDRPGGSMGMLTGVRRRAAATAPEHPPQRSLHHYDTLLQHDVRLHSGCSGAALLNLDGELIGLGTAMAAVTGGEAAAGYALPLDASLRAAVETLRKGEEVEYGFLGVAPSVGQAGPGGVAVGQVTPNTPAEAAGLRPFDVIVRINGRPVRTQDDLFLGVGSAPAGSRAVVRVRTLGRERDVTVTLAKLRHDLPFLASVRPDPVFGLRVEYASVLQQVNAQAGATSPDRPGVGVKDVAPGSPAAAAFKGADGAGGRWLVTHVDGTAVAAPAEFYAAARGRRSVRLTAVDYAATDPRPREITLP